MLSRYPTQCKHFDLRPDSARRPGGEMQPQHADQSGAGESGNEKKVRVAISTTAGFFPEEGFDELPSRQKVEVQLGKVANKLEITNTASWVATVSTATGKKTVVVGNTYAD